MAEYAILAAAIAAACSIAVLFLSGGIGELFGSTSTPMKTAPFGPPSPSPGLTYPTTLAECANGGWKDFPQFTSEASACDVRREPRAVATSHARSPRMDGILAGRPGRSGFSRDAAPSTIRPVPMRRASFIAAVGAALVAAGSGAGAPTPADRPSPQVAIFYYAWYGTPRVDGAWQHWGQGQHTPPQDIGSAYYPSRGPYSSSAASVVRSQMREIAATGIDTVIVSWWGPGSVEDARLRPVAAAARAAGLGVALHVEPWAGRTPAEVVDGLRSLDGLGIRDVYVYDSTDAPDEDWRSALQGIAGQGLRVFAHTSLPGKALRRRLPGPLHVRRAPLRRQVVREDVRERASARAPLRARRSGPASTRIGRRATPACAIGTTGGGTTTCGSRRSGRRPTS